MLIEVRQADGEILLDRLELDDPPHPGRWVNFNGVSYLVMQRRNRYQLRNGTYHLASIALLVKTQHQPKDARRWQHGWVIGDPDCRFNARTPLLRCAVWPEGPCETCQHREQR